SGNFLSYIIPPSFFDGLCNLRGYQVGALPAPAPVATTSPVQVQLTQTSDNAKPVVVTPITVTKPAATTTKTTSKNATTTPTVEPKADIWAVPPSVSLGARTSIFWNTQGVTSCTETSPDGSFSHDSLSGGASTVPITAATTFTISCLAPGGGHITNFVTVNLAI
ncbi:MAG: hypothetical protein JO019_02600, partial [Candidatus Kaiserbacteria bacterium]|nr:hypothetical protein [Candidatus Kaiserbacteria bacterium]